MYKINKWIPPANGKKYRSAVEKHNDIATEYEEQYETLYWKIYDKLTYDHMFDNIENSKGVVLDAGGGTGKWARIFAQKGYEVIVTDLSSQMLKQGEKYAKEKGLLNRMSFVKGDICDLPFLDKKFDITISQGNPVCYSNNPEKAISEIARVTKQGGDVVISVHNKLAMMHYFYYIMGKVSFNDLLNFSKTNRIYIDFPIYAFTPNKLIEMCQKYNLCIKSIVGKQLISGYVQSENYLHILSDKKLFDKTIELEKKYWSSRDAIGMASHLEVSCRKE